MRSPVGALAALIEVVAALVRGGKPIDTGLIRRHAAPLVRAPDLNQFVAMAFNDLHHLHDGNLARYRLRRSEYRAWRPLRAVPAQSPRRGAVR